MKPGWHDGERGRRRSEEAERRKAHDAVCERVDKLTRSQAAKQLLSPDGLRFLTRLAAKHKDGVEVIGFAGDMIDVKTDAINELFPKEPPRPLPAPKKEDKDKEEPEVPQLSLATMRLNSTDLELPLARALERSGQK